MTCSMIPSRRGGELTHEREAPASAHASKRCPRQQQPDGRWSQSFEGSPGRHRPSTPDGPVLDRDVVHGEVGGVARRQASINARGGGGDQAVGLVKG
ncbi:MAG: hypothetical protein QOC69_690, partial [Mycobacterium sp.]|nr:hypothetical protein [Mycobacterium sp.]